MVDALDSKSSAARRVGSSPTRGTILSFKFVIASAVWAKNCHPERSEGSRYLEEILRYAQNDTPEQFRWTTKKPVSGLLNFLKQGFFFKES
jgi:hypothetical protein